MTTLLIKMCLQIAVETVATARQTNVLRATRSATCAARVKLQKLNLC